MELIQKKMDGLRKAKQDREMTKKSEFNYPDEIEKFSAIYKLGMRTKQVQVFYYKIDEDNLKCVLDLGYYISESNAPQNVPINLNIFFYSPDNSLIKKMYIGKNTNV